MLPYSSGSSWLSSKFSVTDRLAGRGRDRARIGDPAGAARRGEARGRWCSSGGFLLARVVSGGLGRQDADAEGIGVDAGHLAGQDPPDEAGGVMFPARGMDRLQPGRPPGGLAGMAPGAGKQRVEAQPETRSVERILLVAEQGLDLLQAAVLLGFWQLKWGPRGGVPGRAEYLNEKASAKSTSRISRSVSWWSASVSPDGRR